MREYVGFIWIDDQPRTRLSLRAHTAAEARAFVVAEYGDGHTISLWNEFDAKRPR